jgi:T5SS/PEP-CTERM-associated repeat protein
MNHEHFLKVVVAVVTFLAAGHMVWGGASTWMDSSGGLWNDPTNWSGGVATTDATFNLANSYTVTFDVSPTISDFGIENGTVTFALAGHTLTTTVGGSDIGVANNGQTGRLTVLDGSVVSAGNLIGANSIDTGFLTISTGATFSVSSGTFQVGANGNGTLTVSNGGQLTTANNTIASGTTSFGTATVSGTGSQWTTTAGNFIVGASGLGALTVSGGGSVVSSGVVTLGNNSSGTGTVTVTGSSSLLDASVSGLTIGNSGEGHLTISSGGTIVSAAAVLGSINGGTGDATVTGAGSSWNITGQLTLGFTTAGSLNIASGGAVNISGALNLCSNPGSQGDVILTGNGSTLNVGGTINVGSGNLNTTGTLTVGAGTTLTAGALTIATGTHGTMTMNGGTVDVSSFTHSGTFNFNDGLFIDRGQYTNGMAAAPLVIDGNTSAALPTLQLIGNFGNTNITTVTVGNARQGALVISDGRNLSAGASDISIGALSGSNGSITVSGAGAQLSTTGKLAVGGTGSNGGGTGLLTIGPGGSVSTGPFTDWPGGNVILNGGTLSGTFIGNSGGAFTFNSGVVNFSSVNPFVSSGQLDLILGAGHLVGFGRTLSGSNALNFQGSLTVSGGTVSTGTTLSNGSALAVTDGTLSVSTTLTNSVGALLQVSDTGLVTATSGITNNGTFQLNNNLIPTAGGTLTNSGTIRGSGFIGNNLTNNNGGQVQLTTGNRLEFQGATNTNSGLMSLAGGELVFTGPLTNSASTGLISGADAIVRTDGITNNGSLAFTAGTMHVYGDITNNVGGLITCSGGGTTTFYDDVTIASGASSVRASAVGGTTSKVVFFGSYNGGIVGGGTAFIEGDHRPGNSPGVVSFGGDVAYDALATLHIDIGGTTAGTGPGHHDQVNVAGQAALGGALDLVPFNGFVPASGDKFVVMTYASASGTFATVTGTTPAPGLTYTPVYSPTNLTILTTTTGEKTWAVDSSGNASLGANWNGGVAPGGVGDSATFSTIITAPRVVTIDGDTTVGALKFDSPISYTIAGPHAVTLQATGSNAASIHVVSTHGNGEHTISAPLVLASDLNLVHDSSGTLHLSGSLDNSASRTITKLGTGTAEIAAAPTLGANAALNVNAGTLRFAASGGSAVIGVGVSVNVSGSATLELAGSVSALASSTNRTAVANSSAALAGLLVSGTNQIVGGIDGSGTTLVNAGSDLTATHIVQSALIIGGTAGSPALVTIDASDASGNPLDGLAVPTTSLTFESPSTDGGNLASSVVSGVNGDPAAAPSAPLPSNSTTGAAGVPEPSSLILLAIGGLSVACAAVRRWRRLQFS